MILTRSIRAATISWCLAFSIILASRAPGKPLTSSVLTSATRERVDAVPKAETIAAPADSVPLGNAADHPETSAALTRLLAECARAYATCDTFRASGTYITAFKRRGAKELVQTARLEIYFVRPDKLKVTVLGRSISAGFLADGARVTMFWPDEKEYYQMRQPRSLASFSEVDYPGEIYVDESGAIMRSVVGALLVSCDPLGWLHANVVEYHYEGIEKVTGVPTWRIKFVQENPDVIVNNWVDPKTGFLRRISSVRGTDASGQFVGSYENSEFGAMELVVYDQVTTAADAVSEKDFVFKPGKHWTARTRPKSYPATQSESGESLWSRLLRVAAAETGQVTTYTLDTDTGSVSVTLGWTWNSEERLASVERVPESMGVALAGSATSATTSHSAVLGVGSVDGKVSFLDGTGKYLSALKTGMRADHLAFLASPGNPLVVVAQATGDQVRAYRPDGTREWTYRRGPGIADILVDPGSISSDAAARIYVAYGGLDGLYTLDAKGDIVFATRRVSGINCLSSYVNARGERQVIASAASTGLSIYDRDGHWLENVGEDQIVSRIASNLGQEQVPLLALVTTDLKDIALRGLDARGQVQWTVGVAQNLDGVEPVALDTLPVSVRGIARRWIAVLLSDGRLGIFDDGGFPVWRGKIRAVGSPIHSDSSVCQALAAVDLDSDGTGEVYVAAGSALLQLRVGR